jgi:putative NADH-flavin reductase
MKIAIFGGTGRTGILIVEHALKAGHEVVALVRTPSKMTVKHDRLHLIQGDVMNHADVEKAITGVDAVVSALAPTKGAPKDLFTKAFNNIIAAMKKQGIRRLVTMSGAGVRYPQDKPKFMDKFIVGIMKVVAKDVLADSENYNRLVQNSGLDWTVVRGPMLTNDPYTGNYRAGYLGGDSKVRVARADIAEFVVKQLNTSEWMHKAPVVTGA